MPASLILPMFFHLLWCALLYAALTVVRAPAVWNLGAAADGSNPLAAVEKRVAANLSNQFEWPLFFYVVCLIVMINPTLFDGSLVALAWVFLGGRLLHSLVQICTANVRLRGVVFTLNFIAVLGMWAVVMGRFSATL